MVCFRTHLIDIICRTQPAEDTFLTHYWFISPKDRQRSFLVLVTFLLAFLVILLGAFTRLTDAGLSCPDWPNCYGFITAPHTDLQLQGAAKQYPMTPVNVKKAWTEMTHRYFAGTEGILILIFSLSTLFARQAKNLKSSGIAIALMGLVVVQIMLGMLTVTEKLKPVIVLSHLLTGLSILSLLWWAYLELKIRKHPSQVSPRKIPSVWLWLALMVVAAQIALGGWVSTHYAGLACVDFPYCNGQLLPAIQWNHLGSDLISIHMLHRIGAAMTAAYLAFLSCFLISKPVFRLSGILILTLIALQLTLGILNILWLRPVWIALVHQGVAILILLTVIATLVKSSNTAGAA
jgi:cytochrome c oxidase assembly protein subunit 15